MSYEADEKVTLETLLDFQDEEEVNEQLEESLASVIGDDKEEDLITTEDQDLPVDNEVNEAVVVQEDIISDEENEDEDGFFPMGIEDLESKEAFNEDEEVYSEDQEEPVDNFEESEDEEGFLAEIDEETDLLEDNQDDSIDPSFILESMEKEEVEPISFFDRNELFDQKGNPHSPLVDGNISMGEIKLNDIVVSTRTRVNEDTSDLELSISKYGQLEEIRVTPLGDGSYVLLVGYRRFLEIGRAHA